MGVRLTIAWDANEKYKMFILRNPGQSPGVLVVRIDEEYDYEKYRSQNYLIGLFLPVGHELRDPPRHDFVIGPGYDIHYDDRHFTPEAKEITARGQRNAMLSVLRNADPRFAQPKLKDSYDAITFVESPLTVDRALRDTPENISLLLIWEMPDEKEFNLLVPRNVTLCRLLGRMSEDAEACMIARAKCYVALENNYHIATALCNGTPCVIPHGVIEAWLDVCDATNSVVVPSNNWHHGVHIILRHPDVYGSVTKTWSLRDVYNRDGFIVAVNTWMREHGHGDFNKNMPSPHTAPMRRLMSIRKNQASIDRAILQTLEQSQSQSSDEEPHGLEEVWVGPEEDEPTSPPLSIGQDEVEQ